MVIKTRSEAQTMALGGLIAKKGIFCGEFIALYGELGAGKTALTRGIGQALGIDDIKSPTFAIVRSHDTAVPLHHFDIYRLSGEDELYDIGFMDYLDGAVIMEWPQNALQALPKERLDVHIQSEGGDTRVFRFKAHGKKHEALLEGLKEAFGEVCDAHTGV